MSDIESDTLYNIVRNSDKLILKPSENKYFICCCVSEKWCFEHIGVAGIKEYDTNINNYCLCLDCCSWCLEFNVKKISLCKKKTNCYICCCTIYFT